MQGLQSKLARPGCCLTHGKHTAERHGSLASLPVEVSVAIQHEITCVLLLTCLPTGALAYGIGVHVVCTGPGSWGARRSISHNAASSCATPGRHSLAASKSLSWSYRKIQVAEGLHRSLTYFGQQGPSDALLPCPSRHTRITQQLVAALNEPLMQAS